MLGMRRDSFSNRVAQTRCQQALQWVFRLAALDSDTLSGRRVHPSLGEEL
jgi:hypothetical protein